MLVAFLQATIIRSTRIIDWDALGMRGTCSAGFKLMASGGQSRCCRSRTSKIHPQTMMPVAHIAWSGAWAGIAAGAVERARLFVRNAARKAERAAAARRCAPHARQCDAAHAAGLVAAALQKFEAASRDEPAPRSGRIPDRDEPAQGQCLRARRSRQ